MKTPVNTALAQRRHKRKGSNLRGIPMAPGKLGTLSVMGISIDVDFGKKLVTQAFDLAGYLHF